MRGAVRGHLVASKSQQQRRGETRGKRRERARKHRERRAGQNTAATAQQEQEDIEAGADRDAQAAEAAASWHILSAAEEQKALDILGPRPWYSLCPDMETVVIDLGMWPGESPPPNILQNGQLLRVGYYELRGISEWEVARRLRRGALRPNDRHGLRQAGFILPDLDEQIAVDGHLVPGYAGYESVLATTAGWSRSTSPSTPIVASTSICISARSRNSSRRCCTVTAMATASTSSALASLGTSCSTTSRD
jgi:hypothetical protein